MQKTWAKPFTYSSILLGLCSKKGGIELQQGVIPLNKQQEKCNQLCTWQAG